MTANTDSETELPESRGRHGWRVRQLERLRMLTVWEDACQKVWHFYDTAPFSGMPSGHPLL